MAVWTVYVPGIYMYVLKDGHHSQIYLFNGKSDTGYHMAKGFICRCRCLYCCLPDSQVWPVCEVTGHIDLPMATYSGEGQHMSKMIHGKSASSVHTTIVYMSCNAHGKLRQCAATCTCDIPVGLLQLARPTVPVCSFVCTFCVIFCGMKLRSVTF